MNVKKVAIIGAIALVVIGCVLAAGCTSNTTTQQTQTISDDKIAGAWVSNSDDGKEVVVMTKDGNGFIIKLAKDEGTISPRLLKYSKFTWKKNADGTITHKIDGVASPFSLKYDSAKDAFTVSNGITLTRLDPITGIWFKEGTDVLNGKTDKVTNIYLPDGTGYDILSYPDGSSEVIDVTWKKNSDGSYSVVAANEFSDTYTFDKNTGILSSSKYSNLNKLKKYADHYYYLSILGPWYNADEKCLTVFNGDGTGTLKVDNKISNFTWSIPEFGKFKIVYVDGDGKGKESIWTYDREKDTFTCSGLLTGTAHAFVRPTTSIGDLTITKFASSQQTPVATGNSSAIGQWICPDFIDIDGKTFTVVQTIKADGTGYWFHVENSNQGINLLEINKSTFDKNNLGGSFDKKSSDGNTHKMVYDSAKDIIVQDGKNTFTRINPLVGIWTGISSEATGKGKSNLIVNADGTGIATISYDDGTCIVLKVTWTENADGTYALVFSNGTKRTYTVASDGKTLKTDDGRTKTKQFLDTTFLVSVTGPWYNKENDVVMIFNGDGTGIGKNKNGAIPFTWKVNDIGKFSITYTGGTANDGSSLKEKTFDWTYDRINNEFTSQNGYKFIRPLETIKDRITYK